MGIRCSPRSGASRTAASHPQYNLSCRLGSNEGLGAVEWALRMLRLLRHNRRGSCTLKEAFSHEYQRKCHKTPTLFSSRILPVYPKERTNALAAWAFWQFGGNCNQKHVSPAKLIPAEKPTIEIRKAVPYTLMVYGEDCKVFRLDSMNVILVSNRKRASTQATDT